MRVARPVTVLLVAIATLAACSRSQEGQHSAKASTPRDSATVKVSPPAATVATTAAPTPASSAAVARATGPSPSTGGAPSSGGKAPAACPSGMVRLPGGEFWVGVAGAQESGPRFKTRLAPFCMDRTEVTVRAYDACVTRGDCKPPEDGRRFCNARFSDRGDHPVNCVTWFQAREYCAKRGARLPDEIEWEYAARGGDEYRRYSWGNLPPDGRNCWKHPGGSCKVGSYPAGAFGLFDMTGNVWEWTASWYGPYPWEPAGSPAKVNRGGSWSRRFVKWMGATLRNRYAPKWWGESLGFRCAATPVDAVCPFGDATPTPDAPGARRCRRGVVDVPGCEYGRRWNGLRCARPGDDRRCPKGQQEAPGHGCVVPGAGAITADAAAAATKGVTRRRAAPLDADCSAHYPGRPHAYRYVGGSHHGRNAVARGAGCKNRDVGAGWNSCCCP